jgi:hypothetical protein
VIEHITFHTNLYASYKEKPYRPVTEDEIKVFLGINIFTDWNKSTKHSQLNCVV